LTAFAPNVRWACGFTGSNALLLVTRDAAHFVTDKRYGEQAGREVEGAEVHVPGYDLFGHLVGEKLLPERSTVLIESEHVSVQTLVAWRERSQLAEFRSEAGVLRELVARKTEVEVAAIRAAQAVTEAVFGYLVAEVLRPGVREQEVAAEIAYQHLRRGCSALSFDPIVGSGPNGALAHARAGERKLEAGDLVVIDMGGYLNGYASDMTRTVAIGEPGKEARRVYGVVLEAQQRALEAAHAGIRSDTLDAAARDVIEAAGYGEQFGHSLGHGVGLQVHEWPAVSFRSEAPLPASAVVSIEPGIYLPGELGVRIEDLIVLREGGSENLTRAPKELLVL
jgi:Xaa-Pro aminopeptidase